MMPRLRFAVLTAALVFAACDSKVDTQVDEDLLSRIEAVSECFPGLVGHMQALLDVADTWRLQDENTDPTGLTVQRNTPSTGQVTATLAYDKGDDVSGSLSMVIRFFSQAGVERTDINFDDPVTANSLSQLIDNAATQMTSDPDPFISGVWTLTGTGGVTGSGAEVGMIGGSLNQNELEEVRTIVAASPGTPTASGSRSDEIADAHCRINFNTTSLLTDQTPGQEFPEGVISVSLTRFASGSDPEITMTGTITFDGTAVAVIAIDDVGSFSINLLTRAITANN